MTGWRLDHVALEVADFDARIASLVDTGAMRLIRRGSRYRTGQRIAMLGDTAGMKLELIEAQETASPAFVHLAFRVDDADDVHATMLADGWRSKREPHSLDAAQARSALVTDGQGLDVQLIAYEPTSPDLQDGAPPDTTGR